MKKIKILFITGSRSDYFLQRPILKLLKNDIKFKSHLILTGAHFSKKFRNTFKNVESDNLSKIYKVKSYVEDNKQHSRSIILSNQIKFISRLIKDISPNLAVAPYDREEAMAIALAATYNNIPLAHLGAGDLTEYNVDGLIRHSVSKLSQFLFTSTKQNKNRLINMGENNNSIFHIGHTALDRYKLTKKKELDKLKKYFGIDIQNKPLILMIQHPVSNFYSETIKHYKQTLIAIDNSKIPTIIIKPNSDPGSLGIIDLLDNYKFKYNNKIRIFENIEEAYFLNLMKYVSLIVGNSSMGIFESGLLKIPVVNVGKRQMKRENSGNILFVPHDSKKILKAIIFSIHNKKYQNKIKKMKNIYGSGNASSKFIKIIRNLNFHKNLLIKKYT